MIAVIAGKQEIAERTLLLTLALQSQEFIFVPGEYLLLKIPQARFPDTRNNRRYFSIASAPTEALQVAMRLRSSGFKKNIRHAAIGDQVEIEGPWGDMVLPKDKSRELVFLAGGMGITPFRSILRFIKNEKLGFQASLLYFNHSRATTAFFEELTELQKTLPSLSLLFSMTQDPEWIGEGRKVGREVISESIKNFENQLFYVAGAPGFVSQAMASLDDLKIPPTNIIYESYTGY